MTPRLPILLAVAGLLAACDPYGGWPEPESRFPYVYTPQEDLEPYEEVRWETETWDPSEDTTQAGQYLLKLAYHRPGAPVEELEHFDLVRPDLPPLGDGLRLSFVGDIMWLGGNWAEFADPAAHLLDGDLRIGNLETPTSPEHPTDQESLGLYTFNAPTELLDGLPLDVLQLNNNHSMDVGADGLSATVAEVQARGFVATGVDEHATVEVGGARVALLSYTWGLNGRDAPADHELFVVPFGHLEETLDLTGMAADIAAARQAGADLVVVMPHWGFEYEYYADPHFMVLGRRMVAAGADLVVGHGPHVVQPPEWCRVNQPEFVPGIGQCSLRTDDGEPRDAAILYSLGNFDTMQPTVPVRTGLVATVSWDSAQGLTGLGWRAITTVAVDGRRWVQPLDAMVDEDVDFLVEALRLDDHLGTGWKRSPAEGR